MKHSIWITNPAQNIRIYAAMVLLSLSIIAAYSNSFQNGFVQDDFYIIETNRDVLNFNSLLKAFTEADRLLETDSSPYYRPLNRASYLLDKALFGSNPSGYHAVNIVLHLICTIFLYFTLQQLGADFFPALFAALLFGVHPVNSEAVNFISGRNNILSTVFVLGSILAFLRAEASKRHSCYFWSAFLFFLGALSKESALMVLPFLVFLAIYRPGETVSLRHILRRDMVFIVYHIVFLSFYGLLRLYALETNYLHEHFGGIIGRLQKDVYIIPKYISLLIIPFGLTFRHEVPNDLAGSSVMIIVNWLVIFLGTFLVLRKKHPLSVIGLVWFGLNFIPISNILPIPSAPLAERYLYLPSIGLFALAANEVYHCAILSHPRLLSIALCASVVIALGCFTFQRNRAWKDDLTLTRSVAMSSETNALYHFEYGYESYLRGDRTTAAVEFRKALAIEPRLYKSSWAFYYLGIIALESGDQERSAELLRQALQMDPFIASAHYALARLLEEQNDNKAALAEYRQFLKTITISASGLVPEVNSNIQRFDSMGRSGATGRVLHLDSPDARPDRDRWLLLQRFLTGSYMDYDPSDIQHKGTITSVTADLRLGRPDRRIYAFRFIRFPLTRTYDVMLTYGINCKQHLYKMQYIAFRDENGGILGESSPERESEVMYEYLWPRTPLRSLADTVCNKTE